MKKVLFFLMAVVCTLTMNSCKQGAENGGATVEVTVTKGADVCPAITVYEYTSQEWSMGEGFIKPIMAMSSVATDENGVAVFELTSGKELNLIDSQSTLYYVVFGEDNKIAGKTVVTIKKGETKQVAIKL